MKKLEEDKIAVEMEIRSLANDVKSGKIKAADGMTKLTELRSKKEKIEKDIAAADMQTRTAGTAVSLADVKEAMMEKRAITLSGTGAINQIKKLFEVLTAKTPLLAGVQKFTGANASTNIPILTALPAKPAAAVEGADGLTNDTLATMGNRTLTPMAWVSILPVTAEAISLGTVDIEAQLPDIFGKSYAKGMHDSILTGDGKNGAFSGIFINVPTANQVQTVTAGKVAITDLAELALNIADKTDSGFMIMNSAVYQLFMSDTATDETTKLYKEGLIRDKSIEGVKIMLTSGAPTATATGSTLVTAMTLDNYALALASEITIEPIRKLGDTKVYYQSTCFCNGSPIVKENMYSLIMQ
jgi:hypothetical protein